MHLFTTRLHTTKQVVQTRELVMSGHTSIVLDLSGVTYRNSSGLGQLIESYATAVSRDSQVKLLNLIRKSMT